VSRPFVFLVTGTDGRWHPGIGDPTILGWLTVVAYLVAAVVSFRSLRLCRSRAKRLARVDRDASREERRLALFWCFVAVAMAALGLNKQLDLQSFLTEVVRDRAIRQGWYESRGEYQLAFVACVAVVGVLGTSWLAFALRRSVARVRLALVGLGTIASFVVVRAASFHHIDAILVRGPLPLNPILELGGICAVVVGARRFLAARRAATKARSALTP